MNRLFPWIRTKSQFIWNLLDFIVKGSLTHGSLKSLPIGQTLLVMTLGVGCGGGSVGESDSSVQATDGIDNADAANGDPKCGTQPNGAPSKCWRAPASPAPSPAMQEVPPPGGDPSVFGQCPVNAINDEDAPLPPVGGGGPLDPVDTYTTYDQNGAPIRRTDSARARQGRYNSLSMEEMRQLCKKHFGSGGGSFGSSGGAGFSGGGSGGIAH